MASQSELTEISELELEQVTGGARGRSQGFGGFGGFFSFLEPLFKRTVFQFASQIGGKKMAQKMYGRHASRADERRAQAALKKFFVAGNKLPKGVPNLFG